MKKDQKILIVEDQRHTRLLITYNLKQAGYEVFEAENGREALDLCREQRPDLILSDVMMPEMDGLQLREAMLQDAQLREIPFVFLTARAQAHEVIRGESLAPDAYVTKPFEPQNLLSTVRRVLEPVEKT